MKQLFNLKSYFTFLSRNKVYTAINVFGLSLSLLFVLIIGVYTRQEQAIDRQHSKANRIYSLGIDFKEDGGQGLGIHHAVLKYFRKHYPEVEQTCGFLVGGMRLKKADEYYNATVLETDPSFFTMFDFPLVQGDRRTCLQDKHNVVVTESFARKWFGTDEVMGREIVWDDSTRFRVSGVAKDFTNTLINDKVEILTDFSWAGRSNQGNVDETFPNMVNYTGASAFIQVKEGTRMLGREQEFTKFIRSFWPSFGKPPFNCSMFLVPLEECYLSDVARFNDNLRQGSLETNHILLAVGLIILLFAVMNYINLTVAQTGYRAREAATHRLFGASRAKIIRQFIFESLVICLFSMAIALLLAVFSAPIIGHAMGVTLDMAILAKPVAIGLLLLFLLALGVLSGIIPAIVLSRAQPIEVIRGTFRRHTKMVLSKVFIIFQNVFTIVLLACALVMSSQVHHLITAPMGFNMQRLICISQGTAFASKDFPTFLDRVKRLPGVSMVSVSMGTPQNGGNNNTVIERDGTYSYQMFVGDKNFMKIYGLTLKDDHRVSHRPVVYLNQRAVASLKMKPTDTHMSDYYKKKGFYGFPNEAAFGGVMNDFKIRNITQTDEHPMLVCLEDKIEEPWDLTIQVEGDIFNTYHAIEKTYKDVFHEDLNEPYPFVDKAVGAAFEAEQRTAKVVTSFAFIAILISLLGLIAMSTYFIQQRNREIAVRKVFGSTSNQIRLKLIKTFLTYVGIAFIISIPIIWYAISDWIMKYNYRITWWPWILIAGIIVLVISFAAVAVQSYRASNENPVKNIKEE